MSNHSKAQAVSAMLLAAACGLAATAQATVLTDAVLRLEGNTSLSFDGTQNVWANTGTGGSAYDAKDRVSGSGGSVTQETYTLSAAPVPEPASVTLLALGLAGIAICRVRGGTCKRRAVMVRGWTVGLIAVVWGLFPVRADAELVHRWTFADGTQDVVGSANGTLFGDAYVQNGKLWLDGDGDYMRAVATGETMTQKTLVAWVELSDLTQRDSGIVSQAEATDGSPNGFPNFDAIVFGERVARQWENGSQFWHRTPTNNGGALENSTDLRMLAIAYESNSSIRIYRDGAVYASVNPAEGLWNISNSDLWYLVGARAYGEGTLNGFLQGAVDEIQVYNTALGASDVSTLYAQGPAPVPEPKGLALAAALAMGTMHLAGRWLRRASSRTTPPAA